MYIGVIIEKSTRVSAVPSSEVTQVKHNQEPVEFIHNKLTRKNLIELILNKYSKLSSIYHKNKNSPIANQCAFLNKQRLILASVVDSQPAKVSSYYERTLFVEPVSERLLRMSFFVAA
ncbi:hypothetical protein DWB64_19175 [Fusibacter sp. A1]|nr:hypothetical protein DWB64_19175 [Fusibacter sp. A1]